MLNFEETADDPRPGQSEAALRWADQTRPATRWGARGAGPAGSTRPDNGRCRSFGRTAPVRPGEIVHPAVPVRLPQPDRDVRPEAGRAGRGAGGTRLYP